MLPCSMARAEQRASRSLRFKLLASNSRVRPEQRLFQLCDGQRLLSPLGEPVVEQMRRALNSIPNLLMGLYAIRIGRMIRESMTDVFHLDLPVVFVEYFNADDLAGVGILALIERLARSRLGNPEWQIQ